MGSVWDTWAPSHLSPPSHTPGFCPPCIFFLTMHLHNISCSHLILLPSHGCSLSRSLWVETESKLRPCRTSISIFQGASEPVLPEGRTFRSFWPRLARALPYLSAQLAKVHGELSVRIAAGFTCVHSCLRYLELDSEKEPMRSGPRLCARHLPT